MLLVFGTAGATGRSRQPTVAAAPPITTASPARLARSSDQALRPDWLDLRFSIIGRTPRVDQKRRAPLLQGYPQNSLGWRRPAPRRDAAKREITGRRANLSTPRNRKNKGWAHLCMAPRTQQPLCHEWNPRIRV